ncbi:spermidine synthase [Kytococcus sedentarius]|uniref:spermidine synthase n=1 Tax=Kytococcus sedentarius TaxID=1276 RepID=UPI0035BC5A75
MGRRRERRRGPGRAAEPDPLADADELPARIGFEGAESGGVVVVRDGRPQSHVDLEDPLRLEFPYIAHLAAVLDLVATPAAPERVGVTHVGGAGLTLPRYVQATRPGSPQIVLEPDTALTDAVRARLPLPAGHRIRVRPQDGRTGVAGLKDASADAVVVDAFDEGLVPADLLTPAFAADCRRVLAPGGVLAMNVADEPGLARTGEVLAAWADVGWQREQLALIGAREVLNSRRGGNVVVVASDAAPGWAGALRQRVGRSALPTEVRAGAELARWV